MRLDRAVTLLACRAAGSLSDDRTMRLPVLMYHSISAAADSAGPYYRIDTHPAVFAEHMQLLSDEGYRGVSLSEGLAILESPATRSKATQPVAVTFDDGYRDFLTDAVPQLQRFGFNATMYLPTGFIQHSRQQFKGRECLTWSEVRELHGAGFEFGSHTVTHPRLVDLGWGDMRTELIDSKRAIERELATEVTAFSFPYAFPQQDRRFAARFTNLLRSTGYHSAVTTVIGRVRADDNALCLPRLPVNSCDDPPLLGAKLRGFYDWMAAPQAASKQLRGHAGR